MRYLSLMVLLLIVGCLPVGCAGWKAVDSTAAVQAITAGEQHVTYSMVPVPEGIDPSLQSKLLMIPTVPGKDVSFRMYNDAGQVKVELTTQRSAVIDMLLGSIAGIDVEKFAEDARMRAWVSAEREAWMALVGPMIQAKFNQSLASSAAAASQPTGQFQDELKAILLELLKQKAAIP